MSRIHHSIGDGRKTFSCWSNSSLLIEFYRFRLSKTPVPEIIKILRNRLFEFDYEDRIDIHRFFELAEGESDYISYVNCDIIPYEYN